MNVVTKLKQSPLNETVADYIDGAKASALDAVHAGIRTLEQQRARLGTTHADREAELSRLEAVIAQVREPLDDVLIRRGRGLANDADVAKARAAAEAPLAQRDALRQDIAALARGGQNIDLEIGAARAAAYKARVDLMNDAAARIASTIRKDAQLVRRLEVLYACTEGLRDPALGLVGDINWFGVLDEAFPEPRGADLARVMQEQGPYLPPRFGDTTA